MMERSIDTASSTSGATCVAAARDSGVIDRVVALLNPKAIGKPGTSYTIINVERMTPAALAEFEKRQQPAFFGEAAEMEALLNRLLGGAMTPERAKEVKHVIAEKYY